MNANHALGTLATLSVLISTFTSISILAVPVVRICHEAVGRISCARTTPDQQHSLHQRRRPSGIIQPLEASDCMIKVSLMAAAAILASSVPNFGFIVALMGSFACMLISFIMPTICNIAVHRAQLSSLALGFNYLIVAVGVLGMVVGVQSTIAGA
jgi:vesicular inhibitory amino acid transporter